MTEAKRVTLTTISNSVTSSLLTTGSSGTLRFGADLLSQTDKPTTESYPAGGKGSSKTIRLNIELFETDSVKYPEFNYAKLLHVEKKKQKKIKQKSNGFSDPFEDNDDDVARIAKELEKKYGNAYNSGRGKNKRDDVDIGMGYDESDSFIDNTEAYDEIIPDEVETIEGGFYINCGALEFKKLHTESLTTKTDEIIKMPNRPKKRVLSSSSEESSSSDEEDEEDDDSDDEDDEESGEGSSIETSKSKSSVSTKEKKLKSSTNNPAKKSAISTENGGVTMKKSKVKNLTSTLSCSASSSPKVAAEERVSDVERNIKKVEKTTTVKDMLKAQRDNFLKSQTSSNGEAKEKSSAEDNDDEDSSSDDSEDDDDEDDTDENSDSTVSISQTQKDKKQTLGTEDLGTTEKLRTTDTTLPELEPDVLGSIIEFRDGVKTQNLIGKKFQFDDKLSETFLKIDDSLLCLEKIQRNTVFAHLEFQLSLPKYFFLRKAKQLRIKEEKLKSKRAFNKLYKAVTETMPAVMVSYEAELRRYTELLAGNSNSEHSAKMPKKKFPWNTNLRNLLYDVYQVRWTSYPVLGTRKETLEEFITSYMRDKVVDIWPKGWMRYEELQKEIEKRKAAAKKAKEKKKVTSATTSGQSSPNPSIASNLPASIQTAPPVTALSAAATGTCFPNATITTQPASFIKQFEEFTTRSNANSDTDSVASSSASSGLKRKHADTNRSKPAKAKSAKLNGEKSKSTINNGGNNNNNRNVPPTISVDLVSPSKRTDHSINHIMLPNDGSAVNNNPTTSMASLIFSATTAALSQPLKHSSNTHVIDLDNYKSVGDILQTSKQLQAAANAAASSSSSLTVNSTSTSTHARRESSGDSEIEIVGVYPAKQQIKKHKANSRSTTPNSNYNMTTDKTATSSHHSHQHSNNNRKKAQQANSVLNSLPGMDVNKMVSALMELGDNLQIKPVLATGAQHQQNQQQQQSSQLSSNQLPQGSNAHQ